MFKGARWSTILLLGVCMVMATTGCRSRGGPGARGAAGRGGPGSDFVIADGMDLLDIQPLGDLRFDEAEFYAGRFEPVYFAFDSSVVEPAERMKVEAIVEEMRRNPGSRLIVAGHTDERGSAAYNLALGERRALAVRAFMTNLGIDGARIQTRSYGEEMPAVMGTGEEVWRLNRRAEFSIAY